MPRVIDNIQHSFSGCKTAFQRCCQWVICHQPSCETHPQYDVLCLGMSGAGKSVVLSQLVGDSVDEKLPPTTGFNIKTFPFNGTIISVKEIGGGASVRPFWKQYFGCTRGVLYVIDGRDSLKDGHENESEGAVVLREMLTSLPSHIPLVVLVRNVAQSDELEHSLRVLISSTGNRKWVVRWCGTENSATEAKEAVQVLLTMVRQVPQK